MHVTNTFQPGRRGRGRHEHLCTGHCTWKGRVRGFRRANPLSYGHLPNKHTHTTLGRGRLGGVDLELVLDLQELLVNGVQEVFAFRPLAGHRRVQQTLLVLLPAGVLVFESPAVVTELQLAIGAEVKCGAALNVMAYITFVKQQPLPVFAPLPVLVLVHPAAFAELLGMGGVTFEAAVQSSPAFRTRTKGARTVRIAAQPHHEIPGLEALDAALHTLGAHRDVRPLALLPVGIEELLLVLPATGVLVLVMPALFTQHQFAGRAEPQRRQGLVEGSTAALGAKVTLEVEQKLLVMGPLLVAVLDLPALLAHFLVTVCADVQCHPRLVPGVVTIAHCARPVSRELVVQGVGRYNRLLLGRRFGLGLGLG
eukprot:Hpha_TRINITY_DN16281_c4_g3::TRINITY_DN16281_c4_g3_i1::g.14866::m.14866